MFIMEKQENLCMDLVLTTSGGAGGAAGHTDKSIAPDVVVCLTVVAGARGRTACSSPTLRTRHSGGLHLYRR